MTFVMKLNLKRKTDNMFIPEIVTANMTLKPALSRIKVFV